MLFQAVVIFLPILNFFQISCERGKVHWYLFHKKFRSKGGFFFGLYLYASVTKATVRAVRGN